MKMTVHHNPSGESFTVEADFPVRTRTLAIREMHKHGWSIFDCWSESTAPTLVWQGEVKNELQSARSN